MSPSVAEHMGGPAARSTVPAVVLAGGRATRMGGGDKPLVMLAGATLLDHVLARLAAQATPIAINANGDPGRFARWGLPVLPDPVPDQPGPLAGVLAAMLWARECSAHVLTVPGDAPFLPADLAHRLAAAGGAGLAHAMSLGRAHPVVALWPVALAQPLAAALARGERRVAAFAARHGAVAVAFPGGPPDPFANVNTPADLARTEAASHGRE